MKKGKILITSLVLSIMFMLSNLRSVEASPLTADELYKEAYNAVLQCQYERTQQSINYSRECINRMKGTGAAWAVGEFSKLTDAVQQDLFEKFMSYLFYWNGNPKVQLSQTEINEARDLVISFDTYIGNKSYTSSWSSAVDKYQQILIDECVRTVEMAEKERTELYKNIAYDKVNNLLTAKNNTGVMEYANKLLERVNAIVVQQKEEEPSTPEERASWNNYIRTNIAQGETIPQFQVTYDKKEWMPVGIVQTVHDANRGIAQSFFSGNDYYRSMSPYACTFLYNRIWANDENYTDIVRLADGKILLRAWESGKIEEFEATELSQEQIVKYKTLNYRTLIDGAVMNMHK